MPTKRSIWLVIGNSFLVVWIGCMAIVSFCVLPYWATHDLAPYTKTVANTMRALFYAPCIVPTVVIVLGVICYYCTKKNAQQVIITLAVLMPIVVCVASIVYVAATNDFLDNYVVYQGSCRSLDVGVSAMENKGDVYVNFVCDNDPSHVFKVWDPRIIAYAANHSGAPPRQYQLSARHTLLPIPELKYAK